MVSHKIFIGSSKEAEPLARKVGDLIDEHEGTEAVLWSALFPAGVILLEQIERLPNEIAGAVLVATPDLECRRNEASFLGPTANVVFEYAYLSARLGRRRVSILQIDDVDVPSDLHGVRLIKDDQRRYRKGAAFDLLQSTRTDLWRWLDQLPRLAPRLPAISEVHGYSGTWSVRNQFTRWRDQDVQGDDSVYFTGKTIVVFQSNGQAGSGVQIGTLHVSMGGYRVIREVVNEVLTAAIDDDGTVRMRLRLVRSRIVPGTERGAENADPRLRNDLGGVEFPLVLKFDGNEAATLRGPHEFERGADDKTQLAREKFVHVGLFEAPGLEA